MILIYTRTSNSDWPNQKKRVCLCYTNRQIFGNENYCQSLGIQQMPATLIVYKIAGCRRFWRFSQRQMILKRCVDYAAYFQMKQ